MKTFLLLILAAVLSLSASVHAQTYSVTDLGSLNGAPTFATAINDNGVAAGFAQIDANTARAWVFDNNVLSELPGLGGADTRALAIGADGKVYGYATDAAGLAHAVRWDAGVLTDLGPTTGTDGWLPQAVNASGAIVGHTGSAAAPALGFRLDGAGITPLGTLPGATPSATSAAYGINDAGQIVGVASWVGGGTRAFRTDATGMPVSIGTLGANDSFAAAIDTAGNVAGYSVNALNETHAFLFTDANGIKDLGVLSGGDESRGFGLNDSGYVVGMADTSAGAARAFLWTGSGALRDLNDLIPPTSGWALAEAQDINTGGDIVGYGTVNGETHAFLLERYEGADTLAPIAVATATLPGNGATTTTVTVKFWDNEKVVTNTTHSVGTIRITAPNLYDMPGTAYSWFSTDAQQFVVTFSVPAPGGSWNGADNGTYEIRLAANQVSDLAGNRHPGGVIGTFTVGIQTAPVLNSITLPTTATLGTPVNLSFNATGSYPAAAGDLFTVAVDWDGDGAVFETLPGRASNAIIPHTFTSLGSHTVRVRVTDPHGLQSSERTAQIAVANTNVSVISEVTAATLPAGVSTVGAVATVQNGKLYMFGTSPWANNYEEIPIYTWNFLPGGAFNPGAPFVSEGNMNIGPLTPEWAAVDGRNRVVVYRAEGGSTYTSSGGVGGNIATKTIASFANASAVDDSRRYYSFYSSGANFRYDAGASGAGTWTQLPALPAGFTPATASYDGAGRIIIFGGTTVYALDIAANTLTQLPDAPYAFSGAATLGADGFIYLMRGTEVWTFNPASNSVSLAGFTAVDHSNTPVVLGADGFLYLIGGYNSATYSNAPAIYRIDTRAGSALRAPRITSVPTGTTLSLGIPWTHQIAAGGKPSPAFSIVRGPAGLSVDGTTGLVSWTPALIGPQAALVRASNSAGTADQLITFNVLAVPPDTTPPTAPTNLAVFNITTNSADISWTGSTDNIGVTGYRVMEKRTSGSRWHRTTYYYTLGTTTGTSWHFANLPACSTRTYYVGAIDAAGNLSAKATVTFMLQCPPAIYADGSGTFGGLRAIVSEPWTSNVFTATGNPLPTLSVTSAPAGAVWHVVSASSGYFTWTASAGQEGAQSFVLGATSIAGSASFTRTVQVYPAGTDLIPPGTPGNFVVDQLSWDSCRVTWSSATDNYGIALYRVSAVHRQPRRRFHRGPYDDHVVTFTVPAGTTQAVIPGLRASTSYVVSVTAQDTAGLWGYSASTSVTMLPQPFEVPNVLQTVNGDGSLAMSWAGLGYYWKFTVECTDSLATPNWQPVAPASQWPSFVTTYTIVPEAGVPQRFYHVRAIPAAAP